MVRGVVYVSYKGMLHHVGLCIEKYMPLSIMQKDIHFLLVSMLYSVFEFFSKWFAFLTLPKLLATFKDC